MNNTFVSYDRNTESVWYPLKRETLDAVAGPEKGEAIEFISKPKKMPLREWAELHPDTEVLLPPPPDDRMRRRMEQGHKQLEPVLGTWDMTTEFSGRSIDAVMTVRHRIRR